MNPSRELPEFVFFRDTPDDLMSRPPLCSSLQTLESSFFLIALERFPHALTARASSAEGAMKAMLNIPQDQVVHARQLFKRAIDRHTALSAFTGADLRRCRETRNRIVHYGFSPRDEEEAATLLLQTGFPFLRACYREFFRFDLARGLANE